MFYIYVSPFADAMTTMSFTDSSFASASYSSQATTQHSKPAHDSYFDIDDILSSQQKLPCTFEQPLYQLGFLNPNSSDEHLQAGSKLDLPFWLAKVLCSKRRQIVSVELPKSYRESQRDILSADANVVDLYKLGPYYYSMGVKLLCFDIPGRDDHAKSLLETFLNRFRRIMDHSQHAFQSDTTPLTTRLDETERRLFSAGQRAMAAMEAWERGHCHRITVSNAVLNIRKRKRQPSK